MLLEAVKNNSARINIELVELKCGLARKRGARGENRVHKLLYTFPSWTPTGTHEKDWWES